MAKKRGNKRSAKKSAPKRSAPKAKRSAPKRSAPKRSAPKRSATKAKQSNKKQPKKLSTIRSTKKNQTANKARRSDLRGRFKKDVFVDNAKAAGVKKIRSRKDLKKIRDFLNKKDKDKGRNKNKNRRKGKDKKDKTLQTIKPISHKKKGTKWDPGGVEKQVKNNWDNVKDQYKGPKRLKVNFKSTGLMKKYGSDKGDGFKRSKFLADIKSSALNRYKSKGGTKANLDQEQTPNFDKIPDQYGRTLNAVRGSLSGIKKSPTADSVGSKLTKSYAPAPDKKATRKKRGLNILGIANNGITAS